MQLLLIHCLCLLFLGPVCLADQWRIIRGDEALEHEFPSIASIERYGRHYCGGTLINADTVLTAAHCVYTYRFYTVSQLRHRLRLKVVLGAHNHIVKSGREISIPVTKCIVHKLPKSVGSPTKHKYVYGNDIALLKLAVRVRPSRYIQFATLPQIQDRDPEINETAQCTVTGWGRLRPHSRQPSNTLQKIQMQLVSRNACTLNYTKVLNNPSNLCAGVGGNDPQGRSACKGDSGGPLYCTAWAGGRTLQVGLVSYGKLPCGQKGVPIVYTRISHFVDWIKRHATSNDLDGRYK